jgi:hypothetical protein
MLPSHKENSLPGSVDITASSPDHKCMVSGLVSAKYKSCGGAAIEKYFLKSFIFVEFVRAASYMIQAAS